MIGGVEGAISLGSVEWGTMEVGSAKTEEMATLGRFLREFVHQNCGRASFHAVDAHHSAAAPKKGVITSNYRNPLVEVDDAIFGREFSKNDCS